MPTTNRKLAGDLPPDEPDRWEPDPEEPIEPSDLDEEDIPCTDDVDDGRWDAFIADDDECDPEPEWNDFWVGNSVASYAICR